jgi:hypothetical protein
MTPLERAEFEADLLIRFFEWLEPENIDRFLELARKKNRSLFELIVVGLRRSFDRPGTTPEEIDISALCSICFSPLYLYSIFWFCGSKIKSQGAWFHSLFFIPGK